MKNWFHLSHPPATALTSLKAGLGAGIAIGCLFLLSQFSGEMLIMAPFGASSVLLFAVPKSPLAQPANLIGGHLLCSATALICVYLIPDMRIALPLAMVFAIGLMAFFRLTHPPAGADPIVIVLGQHTWQFFFFPVLLGSVLLLTLAVLYHLLITKIEYPLLKQFLNFWSLLIKLRKCLRHN